MEHEAMAVRIPRRVSCAAAGRRPEGEPHLSFDPRLVAHLECTAWVAYYRRDWLRFLRTAMAVSRHTLGLSWPTTIRCAWLALRAIMRWAPFPDNDAEGARRTMERFYRILQGKTGGRFDAGMAAALEVEWWRVHREIQHPEEGADDRPLIDALARLYAHLYGVGEASVAAAAEQRVLAMRHSDQWVREGCHADSALIDKERAALARSYAALLAAVRPAPVLP